MPLAMYTGLSNFEVYIQFSKLKKKQVRTKFKYNCEI